MKKILLSLTTSTLLLFGAYGDSNTDYSNAKTFTQAEEPALEALKTVNMILGFIKDSNFHNFVNQGPYKALMKKDEDGNGASSGSGVTTTTEQLNPMVLDVTRDTTWDGTGTPPPMKVKFWMNDKVDGHPMVIIGYIKAQHEVNYEYPLGKMKLDFQGFFADSNATIDTNSPFMKGALSLDKATGTDAANGRADVKFIQDMTFDGTNWQTTVLNMTYDVHVDTNGDGTVNSQDTQGTGVAYTRTENYLSNNGSMASFEIAFSPESYKIQKVDTANIVDRTDPATNNSIKAYSVTSNSETCKSKTAFTKKVYQYGLYNVNDGTRVNINAGFPIENENNDTTGYIGYWGLWSEDNLIKAGDVVHRVDGIDSSKNYTVFQTKGRLIKNTKTSTTMDKLIGNKLKFFTHVGTDMSTSANYVIYWNGSTFEVYGKEQCNETGCSLNTENNPSFNDLNKSEYSTAWSDTLQSNVPVRAGLSNSDTVYYHIQETITPDTNLTLVNFGYEIINPDMNLSNDANYNQESIRADQNSTVLGNVYKYIVDNGVLIDVNRSNKPVIVPSDTNFSITNSSHPFWKWGAQMGPLLDVGSNETDSNASTYNASNAFGVEQNATVFYTWETGLNQWNRSTTLVDNSTGNKVKFDKPLDIAYTHTNNNDINYNGTDAVARNGELFMLHYDGVNLGIPWTYDQTANRWMPAINIDSNVTIGYSNQYVVKALNIGAIPNTSSNCGGTFNPSKDVNTSFVPVREDDNTILLDINETFVTDLNLGVTPDANLSVIKGEPINTP